MTRTLIVILASVVLLAGCRPTPQPIEPVVIDPAELQTFADTFFIEQMSVLHIPGLVFIFVQGGDVVYAQGYGDANLEIPAPLSTDASVVAIGSVSKPFVAMAVMQMVEQEKLDLDTDVNQYLTPFPLEDTYRKPVTLAHLLTHTAGFEDPPYAFNADPQQVQPLAAFLGANLPPRTHRPGKTYIYSNYGYALAALIVEEVSGLSFDQYVEQNIFEPLTMTRTDYLLSASPPEGMVTGYAYLDGEQVPQPPDYQSIYPGGAVVSTAEDMSHFLLAHLQDGCYQGTCILQPSTLDEMHRQQAPTPFEGQNTTFGFVEAVFDEVRLIGHGGATRGFGSSMDLFPEHDMGYFFAFNAECAGTAACGIVSEFRRQFLVRFWR